MSLAARQSASDPGPQVRVGRVTKAHSIKGEVKVQPDFGSSEDFLNYSEVALVQPARASRRNFKVSRCRPRAATVILQLEGVEDRSLAEALVGSEVWVAKPSLPDLPAGEYYWHDLIGLRVETEHGRQLGRVENVFATAGHDIIVVTGTGQEYLVPLKKEFLLKVDAAAGILTVVAMPGLFEIND